MRTLHLGTLLIVSSMTFAVAGILFQSIPFVLLCCVSSAVLVYARAKFVEEIGMTDLRVSRVIVDAMPFAGQPVAMDVKVLNAGPTAVRCTVEDVLPEGCEMYAGSNVFDGTLSPRSQLTLSYTTVPRQRKTYVFEGLRVRAEDEYGLFLQESTVEDGTEFSVHTTKESMERARKLASREHLEYSGLSRHLAMVMYDLEFDNIREYLPGDRSRDIHWKLMSKLGEMYTKVYTREGIIQTMIFVDCSSSMRVVGDGMNKMDHAIDLCMQISKVLLSSFHATGVCLLDEVSVISQVPPSHGRRQFDRIVESLRKVPPAISVEDVSRHETTAEEVVHEEGPEVAPEEPSDAGPAEQLHALSAGHEGSETGEVESDFMSLVRSLGSKSLDRSKGVGFDGVIRNLLTKKAGKKLMTIMITDMRSSRDAVVAGARFCGRKGSKMLVLHLCDDWYEDAEAPLDVAEVERLYGNLQEYIGLEGKLRRTGSAYLRIGPADTTASIIRSMRWGRT